MTQSQTDSSGAGSARRPAEVLFAREEASSLYALVDGAQVKGLLSHLAEHGPPSACMFSGKLDPSVAEVAPYIVELEPDGSFSEWFVENYWGKNAGVFLLSELELKGVRKHLKQFTLARLPDGEQAFFRFYDPRVLRAYLPTCTPEEIDQLLGDVVQCFRVEGRGGLEVQEFTRSGGSAATLHAVDAAAK